MSKVVQMRPVSNQAVANNHKKQSLLNQALKELKRDTGVDFYKVITGDEKEKQRLKFKQHQEKLLEG